MRDQPPHQRVVEQRGKLLCPLHLPPLPVLYTVGKSTKMSHFTFSFYETCLINFPTLCVLLLFPLKSLAKLVKRVNRSKFEKDS